MARFDELKKDPGYAAVLERDLKSLISTSSANRFFRKFSGTTYLSYRSIQNRLFIRRLKQEKPSEIVLHLDTMVLGFQPLQINWGPYIVDLLFRSDVASKIIPVRCYATRLRRAIIDIAVKIVRTGHRIILKVTRALWEALYVKTLWERCNSPAVIC